MNLPFLPLQASNQNNEPDEHALDTGHEPLHNTHEGSEFSDDDIRMVDHPLMYTEEIVAASCR
jgi:hypothetical protein